MKSIFFRGFFALIIAFTLVSCNKKIDRTETQKGVHEGTRNGTEGGASISGSVNDAAGIDPITQAALDQDSTARIFYAQIAAKKERGTKAEQVSSLMEFADYMMFQAQVPPRIKYRPALKAYREVLALDPSNSDAAKNKKQIEDIYAQMGIPIPQD
ncbi:MAG: hypothetical protein SFU91_11305 [Chloroherpetonaceae bacterium]|nr:hypothetical protein [Chloroherpetonaceae bacterium]